MKTKKVNVVYFVGLDVHQNFTAYAVRNREGDVILEGSCASNFQDLFEVLEPYLFSCVIGLECNVEIYPIYEGFKDKSYDIRVANTVQLRTLIGKNDRLDAKRLSDMLRLGTFPIAFIPNKVVKSLRSLVVVRHGMMEESVRTQNRIKCLVRKYGLRKPTKDIGKTYISMLEQYLVANPESFDLRHVVDHYSSTAVRLEKVTDQAVGFAKEHFPKEFEALIRHKGIGPVLVTYFLSEIGPISRFKSEKKLRRYAGIVPCSSESGGKIYGTYLPKTTSRGLLRWAMTQAAHCMIRSNENIRAYYGKKKKQKKIAGKAIMAVASSVSDIIYKTLVSCQQE
jgi:transposase